MLMFLASCLAAAELLQAGVQQEEDQVAVVTRRDGGDDRLVAAVLAQAPARQPTGQRPHAALLALHHRVSALGRRASLKTHTYASKVTSPQDTHATLLYHSFFWGGDFICLSFNLELFFLFSLTFPFLHSMGL